MICRLRLMPPLFSNASLIGQGAKWAEIPICYKRQNACKNYNR